MAHAFARELDCSPWEGLLRAVRIAAGKVAYTEWVLSQATDDLQLEGRSVRNDAGILVHPDTGEPLGVDGGGGGWRNLSWWVSKNEYWVDRLARYSKAAVDAGVAERLVQQVELEAGQLARVLNAVLAGMAEDLDEPAIARARALMRAELLAVAREQEGVRVIEGVAAE